jgi:tRNA threonylcarbamoyladenosine biosynthesis protein TsaE
MKIITKSEAQTRAIAKKISAGLKRGTTLALIGDLGAGKTVFAKGLAQGLGISKSVNSPTFVLMRVYEGLKHPFIKRFVHVDAYRIKKAASLKGIGLQDYIKDEEALVVIEWADRVLKMLPRTKKIIRLGHGKDKERIISF